MVWHHFPEFHSKWYISFASIQSARPPILKRDYRIANGAGSRVGTTGCCFGRRVRERNRKQCTANGTGSGVGSATSRRGRCMWQPLYEHRMTNGAILRGSTGRLGTGSMISRGVYIITLIAGAALTGILRIAVATARWGNDTSCVIVTCYGY